MTMQIKKLVSMPSRTGRHLQRYNQGCRQVVGCIPYRIRKTCKSLTLIEDLEVLLISSQKSPRLMFPKGGWELDEDIELAASRETLEEAGVIGSIGDKLGEWTFKSKSQEKFHEGSMFSLLVTEELDVWPEKDVRQRVWMTVNEAREKCSHPWMKEALEAFVRQFTVPGMEEEPNTFCGLELCREDDLRMSVDEGSDCFLLKTRARMEEGPKAPCRLELCRADDLRPQSPDEDVDCFLLS